MLPALVLPLETWVEPVSGKPAVSLLPSRSFLRDQVCDEPHPLLVKEMIRHCVSADIDEAYKVGRLTLQCGLELCATGAGGQLGEGIPGPGVGSGWIRHWSCRQGD